MRKNSVFLLVPVMLGLAKLESFHIEQIKEIFKFPQHAGIAGGNQKGEQALYFVGTMAE